MNLQDIKNKYNLYDYNNGGGCMALSFELDNNGHYILLTDGSGLDIPSTKSDSFVVGCYNPDGKSVYVVEVSNLERVDQVIAACITLWQFNEDQIQL